MFEDSLFESTPRAVSARVRWTAAASILVQAAVASLLVSLPLLHTALLPGRTRELAVVLPRPVAPPPPRTVVARATSALASAAPMISPVLTAPRVTPSRIDTSPKPAVRVGVFAPMGAGVPLGAAIGSAAPGPVVVAAAPKHIGPVRVSAGVTAGLLLAPIRPVYPPIAKAAHVEGTVVVEAVISKAGTIESLRVVAGPAMLQTAALEAIRAARYQPFKLNGEPTEVQTTITVNFRLGG